MVIWIEIVMFGVLPIAFAIWQIRDVRREQQRRREQQEQQQRQRDHWRAPVPLATGRGTMPGPGMTFRHGILEWHLEMTSQNDISICQYNLT